MKGMLAPKFREVLLGHAEVRQTLQGLRRWHGCRLLRAGRQARAQGLPGHGWSATASSSTKACWPPCKRFKDSRQGGRGRATSAAWTIEKLQRHQGRRYCGSLHHGGNSPVNGGDRPYMRRLRSPSGAAKAGLRPQVVRTRVLRSKTLLWRGLTYFPPKDGRIGAPMKPVSWGPRFTILWRK